MDPWCWSLLAVICGLLYYYFKTKLEFFKRHGIVYKPGLPIMGNMKDVFFRRKHISDMWQEMYNLNKDAKYVGVYDFMTPIILLRDRDLVKSVTVKSFDNFVDRRVYMDDTIEPLLGNNLVGLTGNKWKETRALLTPSFTSSKIKGMFELARDCAKNYVQYLAERSKEENKMVDMKNLFTRYTNDVIATCAFGLSVDSLNNPNNDFYLMCQKTLKLDGIQVLKFFILKISKKLYHLLNIKFINARAAEYFKNIISTTVAVRDENGIRRQDMLQLVMDARHKEGKFTRFGIVEMTAQAFMFFFAGFDTISRQLCFMAHELAINPDIQKKLQDEIDEAIQKSEDGEPGYDVITNLPYLDAVFYETLRRHTQSAVLERKCTKSFELPPALPGGKPFRVQPGMIVSVPAVAIHNDPNIFDNPMKFEPERFYKKKFSTNDEVNLGFGIGPRSCIGNRFALMEVKVLMFHLLAKFNLKSNLKTCNPVKYSKKSLSLTVDDGFWLSIEGRN